MMSDRLAQLTAFLSESPDDPFLKYALATEYLKLNRTADAVHYYEELRCHHADYVGTYYHLGKLYEALGRNEEAVAVYQEGMHAARMKRDMHALAELQTAYRAATGIEDDED